METVLLDFNRIKILEEDQNEKVFQELLAMRKLWLQRNNWHPKVEIEGPDEEIEKYIHYYTVRIYSVHGRQGSWVGYLCET